VAVLLCICRSNRVHDKIHNGTAYRVLLVSNSTDLQCSQTHLHWPAVSSSHGLVIGQAQAVLSHKFAEAILDMLKGNGVACVFPETCGEGRVLVFWLALRGRGAGC
jgi:hypothetical protein